MLSSACTLQSDIAGLARHLSNLKPVPGYRHGGIVRADWSGLSCLRQTPNKGWVVPPPQEIPDTHLELRKYPIAFF
eukprot:8279085-Pyramimonas_sp.AAC.1